MGVLASSRRYRAEDVAVCASDFDEGAVLASSGAPHRPVLQGLLTELEAS